MKLVRFGLLTGTCVAAALLSFGAAAARDLTAVSWGGATQAAQHKLYFEPFANQSGKPVLEESWDGGFGVIQSKVQAGAANWDVVQVEADELALGCADGLYEKLDWDKLGGRDKFIDGASSDCGVGTYVWSMALAYDASKIKDGPQTWADFWNLEKFPGKRSLRKGAKYNLEYALIADGVPVDQVYDVLSTPEGVDRAFAKLSEIKSSIVWWESGAQPGQLLASGEITMAAAYNARITALNRSEKRNLRVVWPGSIHAIDSWVILKDSPNAAAAMDLIAFASTAENQAKLPAELAYGLTNKDANASVPKDLAVDLPTYPDNQKQALPLNVDFWTDNAEALNERFNAWLAQ
jgi:putative spermidine/putrescine transport system substrate-binding protein